MKNTLLLFCLGIIFYGANAQDTFSIVAVDPTTGEVGSAGASCVDLSLFPGFTADFLGELFPGEGAINSQAFYIQTNQANARNRFNMGDTPDEIIQWLVDNDVQNQPQFRQYGIVRLVNGVPMSAAHTGTSTDDYKGHNTAPTYSIQGNILLGQEILDDMEAGFLNTEGDLACKLMGALQGANVVGADTRCTNNGTSSLFAFLKVAQPADDFGSPSFVVSVSTTEGTNIEPIDSLQTLFDAAHDCSPSSVNAVDLLASSFDIYPNPSEDKIRISSKNANSYQLKIVNSIGVELFSNTFQQTQEIDLSAFAKGVYWLQISDGQRSFSKKVIKQ